MNASSESTVPFFISPQKIRFGSTVFNSVGDTTANGVQAGNELIDGFNRVIEEAMGKGMAEHSVMHVLERYRSAYQHGYPIV